MAYEKIVGNISDVNQRVKRTVDNDNRVSIEYTWLFRIDGRQAILKTHQEELDFSDGDEVIAVGKFRNGSLHIRAFRNKTSGAVSYGSLRRFYSAVAIGIILITIGIILIIGKILLILTDGYLIIGLLCLFAGLIFVGESYPEIGARKVLEHAD